jgi:hypothetical protein
MLLDTNGHAGKAVMNLGLDVINRPEEAEIRELFNTIDEDGSGTLEAYDTHQLFMHCARSYLHCLHGAYLYFPSRRNI